MNMIYQATVAKSIKLRKEECKFCSSKGIL